MTTKSCAKFLKIVECFAPVHDLRDRKWIFYIREERSWIYLSITKYESKYYVYTSERTSVVLPDDATGDWDHKLRVWSAGLTEWREKISTDKIGAQAQLFKNLPMRLRQGVIHRRNIQTLLPFWHDFKKELGEKDYERMVALVEWFRKPEPLTEMTVNRYLEYCRVAYEANPETFKDSYFKFKSGLSGREYYTHYADGRCGRLLEIDPDSPHAFEQWYQSREQGGDHPWEIYRGGNSTHISLYVDKDDTKSGWNVGLRAFASTRMLETCKIALAFDHAKLPFILSDRESHLKRLRKEDWIGIVPDDQSIKYAWHDFPKQFHVADCIHFDWLMEDLKAPEKTKLKRQLKHLVAWMPQTLTVDLVDQS